MKLKNQFKMSEKIHKSIFFLAVVSSLLPGCTQPSDNGGEELKDQTATPEDSDIYNEYVRKTEYQTPEEERQKFVLSPEFEITLFASEPDITKTINMDFDEKGEVINKDLTAVTAKPKAGAEAVTKKENTAVASANKAASSRKQKSDAPAQADTQAKPKQKAPTYEEVKGILAENSCLACHSADKKQVGPAYREVAKRNYSNERIVDLIHNPEPQNWPDYATPMPPMPQVSRDDALKIAAWINSLND